MLKYLPHLILAAALIALFGLAAGEVHDFDIFWQLQSGKHMLETGSFIRQDLFSLASEVPRYEHCWLHDALFYAAFAMGGYAGISLLKALLITAAAGLLVATARWRGAGWPAITLLVPPPLLMTFWAWKERPQLWTYLLFAIFLLLLEWHRRHGGNVIWWVLPLTVLWANLHAGAILAVPVLLAVAVGTSLDRKLARPAGELSPLWLVTLFLPLALLATPYATTMLETLFYAPKLGADSGELMQIANIDWLPTTLRGYPGYFKALGLVALMMAVCWRTVLVADLLLLGGLAFMGVKLERHTPFFLLAMAALLPAYADVLLRRIQTFLVARFPSSAALFSPALILLAVPLVIHFALPIYRNNGFLNPGLRSVHFPVAEADFVREQQLPGNLYNSYGAGGYLMWALYPGYRVFWDGRQTSPEMFRLGLQVRDTRPGWEEILARFGVNIVIHEACSQADGARFILPEVLAAHPEWALVRAGESHVVFVRRRAVPADWITRFEIPAARLDETVFNAALQMLQQSPLRREALWEVARVAAARENFGLAREALNRYLAATPQVRRRAEVVMLDQAVPR